MKRSLLLIGLLFHSSKGFGQTITKVKVEDHIVILEGELQIGTSVCFNLQNLEVCGEVINAQAGNSYVGVSSEKIRMLKPGMQVTVPNSRQERPKAALQKNSLDEAALDRLVDKIVQKTVEKLTAAPETTPPQEEGSRNNLSIQYSSGFYGLNPNGYIDEETGIELPYSVGLSYTRYLGNSWNASVSVQANKTFSVGTGVSW